MPPPQMFPVDLYEIFQNDLSLEQLQVTNSLLGTFLITQKQIYKDIKVKSKI